MLFQDMGIPCYLGGMSRGMLGRDNRLQVRQKRRDALRDADVIVLAGRDDGDLWYFVYELMVHKHIQRLKDYEACVWDFGESRHNDPMIRLATVR